VATNPSGLAGSVNIAYDAVPAWTTAAGTIANVLEGTALTGTPDSTYPRIIAAESSDSIDYAQVSDATGDTVITSGAGGLILQTTGTYAGYLKGTMASGTEGQSYNLYAKAQNDENQFSAVRLFNIIGRDYAGSGGVITTYTGFRVHTFILSGGATQTFTVYEGMNVDWIVVGAGGGGGSGGSGTGDGGGGAGGFRTGASHAVTAQAYTITVGAGGTSAMNGSSVAAGGSGGNSSIVPVSGTSIISTGGGGGASQYQAAVAGGSGGGGEPFTSSGAAGAGNTPSITPITGEVTTVQGFIGGVATNTSTGYGGGGGGGASAAGLTGAATHGGAGGPGENNVMGLNDANSDILLDNASAGHDVSNVRYLAGGGGGGVGGSSRTTGAGGSGGGGSGGNNTGSTGATVGIANTGGGGGGGYGTDGTGAVGGSGIVIIRYAV